MEPTAGLKLRARPGSSCSSSQAYPEGHYLSYKHHTRSRENSACVSKVSMGGGNLGLCEGKGFDRGAV